MTARDEILELLRRVARGELTPTLADPGRSFFGVYCGNVGFRVDGWELVVFSDCDEFDYIDHATAPDGRRFTFDDINPNDSARICVGPDELLEEEDQALYDRMVRAFEVAAPFEKKENFTVTIGEGFEAIHFGVTGIADFSNPFELAGGLCGSFEPTGCFVRCSCERCSVSWPANAPELCCTCAGGDWRP